MVHFEFLAQMSCLVPRWHSVKSNGTNDPHEHGRQTQNPTQEWIPESTAVSWSWAHHASSSPQTLRTFLSPIQEAFPNYSNSKDLFSVNSHGIYHLIVYCYVSYCLIYLGIVLQMSYYCSWGKGLSFICTPSTGYLSITGNKRISSLRSGYRFL